MARARKMLTHDDLDQLLGAARSEFAMANAYTRHATIDAIEHVLIFLGYDKDWVTFDVYGRSREVFCADEEP